MSKLVITIELGNAAMETAAEALEAIRRSLLVEALPPIFSPLVVGDGGTIRDNNGNTVGSWEVERS